MATWLWSRPSDQRPKWWGQFAARWLPRTGLAGLAVGVAIVWSWYFSLPDESGRLRVSVLDVKHGEAILIQTPAGARVVIDGGPSGVALSRALARELPLFTTRIDLLVVAGPRDENIGGLPDLLARYRIGRAVVTRATSKSAAYQTLLESLTDKNILQVSAADLPVFDLGEGISLRVLADGENGSALRLEWKRASVLFPIGLEVSDESALLARGLAQPATALLLADHGSEKATQEAWLWAVNPAVVLISVGAGNADGDPAPEVLRRLAGRTVLRTDQHGTITLSTDGQQLWVETEK